jgi:ElaB/YqjD/DUF883 family membrane-anchored ribosome-binding protein
MIHESQATGPTSARRNSGPDGSEHITGSSSGLVREYHKLLADLEDLIGSASTLTGEELTRAKSNLTTRIGAARDAAMRMGNVVSDRVRAGAHATDHYVHESPWQAIGISAAAGLLLGFLLGRRNS